MNRRFDFRDEKTFRMDIKFGTQLERYFFNKWVRIVQEMGVMRLTSYENNGCDNEGEFICSGNTFGADYKFSGVTSSGAVLENEPLEVKWVPTAGKLTLKKADIEAYIKEDANILFIYNTVRDNVDLKKPKDYNMDSLIKRIESKEHDLRWGILWIQNVKRMYLEACDKKLFKPIPYMGKKLGLVVPQKDYELWFKEHTWKV